MSTRYARKPLQKLEDDSGAYASNSSEDRRNVEVEPASFPRYDKQGGGNTSALGYDTSSLSRLRIADRDRHIEARQSSTPQSKGNHPSRPFGQGRKRPNILKGRSTSFGSSGFASNLPSLRQAAKRSSSSELLTGIPLNSTQLEQKQLNSAALRVFENASKGGPEEYSRKDRVGTVEVHEISKGDHKSRPSSQCRTRPNILKGRSSSFASSGFVSSLPSLRQAAKRSYSSEQLAGIPLKGNQLEQKQLKNATLTIGGNASRGVQQETTSKDIVETVEGHETSSRIAALSFDTDSVQSSTDLSKFLPSAISSALSTPTTASSRSISSRGGSSSTANIGESPKTSKRAATKASFKALGFDFVQRPRTAVPSFDNRYAPPVTFPRVGLETKPLCFPLFLANPLWRDGEKTIPGPHCLAAQKNTNYPRDTSRKEPLLSTGNYSHSPDFAPIPGTALPMLSEKESGETTELNIDRKGPGNSNNSSLQNTERPQSEMQSPIETLQCIYPVQQPVAKDLNLQLQGGLHATKGTSHKESYSSRFSKATGFRQAKRHPSLDPTLQKYEEKERKENLFPLRSSPNDNYEN